jgi:hypothetical protein
VTTWAFVSGVLVGWIVGVWMSHRKIRRGRPTYRELLEIVRAQKELRAAIDKRDANVVDFPGNGERKH